MFSTKYGKCKKYFHVILTAGYRRSTGAGGHWGGSEKRCRPGRFHALKRRNAIHLVKTRCAAISTRAELAMFCTASFAL